MKKAKLFYTLLMIFTFGCGSHLTPPTSHFQKQLSQSTDNSPNEIIQFRFIDVGQGDATLITTSKGKHILIDGGDSSTGREKIIPLINSLGGQLELIIASHYDLDHIGGINEVIKGDDSIFGTNDDIIPAQGVLDRGNTSETDLAHLSDYFILTNNIRFSYKPGDSFTIDGVRFEIFAQNGFFSDGSHVDIDPENENAHSISLLITYNDVSLLTSGDLPGPNFENKYEPYDLESFITDLVPNIDILHVSHHGSHNSTNKSFIESVRPRISIISVGKNRYGHPHDTVLDNLRDVNSEIYLTEGDWIEDKEGLSIFNDDICIDIGDDVLDIGKCK